MIPPRYEEDYFQKYVKPLRDYLDKVTANDVKQIKDKLDESGKISIWYKEKALPYIAQMADEIQLSVHTEKHGQMLSADISAPGRTALYRRHIF